MVAATPRRPAPPGRPRDGLAIDDGIAADLRFMSAGVLAAAQVFPADVTRPAPPPSTLVEPRIARYTSEGWSAW